MRVVKTRASRVVKRLATRGVREKRIPSMAKVSWVMMFARTMLQIKASISGIKFCDFITTKTYPTTLNSEPRIARSKPTVVSTAKSTFETSCGLGSQYFTTCG